MSVTREDKVIFVPDVTEPASTHYFHIKEG